MVDPRSAQVILVSEWRGLRNDFTRRSRVIGAIDFAHKAGLLDDEQHELWMRRIDTCPGHYDEGGRVWCAYCGDLPRSEDNRG